MIQLLIMPNTLSLTVKQKNVWIDERMVAPLHGGLAYHIGDCMPLT
jgi:hypothetical protein